YQGVDPIQLRRSQRAAAAKSRTSTVRDAVLAFLQAREAGWSDAYAQQNRRLFEAYVFPKNGALPIGAVNDREVILEVIEPLWLRCNRTAWRIRGLLENFIDWAKFHGYCSGENAARWKGHLAFHLPNPSKIRPVRHYAALPYRDVPAFFL